MSESHGTSSRPGNLLVTDERVPMKSQEENGSIYFSKSRLFMFNIFCLNASLYSLYVY